MGLAPGRLPARDGRREAEIRGSRRAGSRQASTCPVSSRATWSTFEESHLQITGMTTVPAPTSALCPAQRRGQSGLCPKSGDWENSLIHSLPHPMHSANQRKSLAPALSPPVLALGMGTACINENPVPGLVGGPVSNRRDHQTLGVSGRGE